MDNKSLFIEYTTSLPNNKGRHDSRYLHLRKCIEFIGTKNLAYLSAYEMYDLIVNKFKVDDAEVLNNYYSFYANYLNWYIENKEDIHATNVFNNSELLTYGALLRGIAANTQIFSEHDIVEFCNTVNDNRLYVETVVRCFFEGFINVNDMLNLTVNDIDYINRKIKLGNDRQITVSERLLHCLEKLRNQKLWVRDGGAEVKLSLIHKDGFFRFVENKNSSSILKNRMTSGRLFVSKNIVTKHKWIQRKQLYISGIISYMKKKYTDEEIYDIVLTDSKSDAGVLYDVCKECGCKYDGKKLRFMLRPYIMKMKYESSVN